MPTDRVFRGLCGLCCAAVLCTCILAIWGFGLMARNADLGRKPPDKAFTQVFGILPPAGITDLKVAGLSHLSGEVWMRLRVRDVDAVLAEIKQRSPRGLKGPDKDLEVFPPFPSSREYTGAVGWEALKRVRKPQYYGFPKQFGGSGWGGVIVVDRDRKLLFVQGVLY
jgi:hypothetical protein